MPALVERLFKIHNKPVKKLKMQQISTRQSWISPLKEHDHQESIYMQDVD